MTQPSPPRLPDRGRSRIILLGGTTYVEKALTRVPEVANNLVGMFSMLTDPGLGGFTTKQCEIVTAADLGQVHEILETAAIEAEDLLLFYYSGHGIFDQSDNHALYLSLYNTVRTRLATTALNFGLVRKAFRESNARTKIVILDCCYAGQVIVGGLDDGFPMARLNIAGSHLMASAPGHEVARVLPGETRTAFTGRLLDLLETGLPGGGELLRSGEVFRALRNRIILERDQGAELPIPEDARFANAANYPLVANRAFVRGDSEGGGTGTGSGSGAGLGGDEEGGGSRVPPIGTNTSGTNTSGTNDSGKAEPKDRTEPPGRAVPPEGGKQPSGPGRNDPPADRGPTGGSTSRNEPDRPRKPGRRYAFLAAGITLALTAGLIAYTYAPDHSTDDPAPSALPTCSAAQPVELVVTASVDVSSILAEQARTYGGHSVQGTCVKVAVDGKDSGLAMTALRSGWKESDGRKPDVWSPASQVWLSLARLPPAGEKAAAETTAVLPETPKGLIATSPLVIAMPDQMAEAKHWKDQQLGWRDLAAMAHAAPTYWRDNGPKDWGPFRLGKTDPRYSTSGLNATIAAFTAAASRTQEGITAADVAAQSNQDIVKDIENAAVHYGDTTLTFLANLRHADDSAPTTADPDPALNYISAVTVEESAVIAYNLGYPCGTRSTEQAGCDRKLDPPKTKLKAFYPKDGQLSSDHPYIELNGIGQAKQTVADDFLRYLHTAEGQRPFAEIGMRGPNGEASDQIVEANGALPKGPKQPLKLPAPAVADQLLDLWPKLRKPSNVLLVLDTSGSMKDAMDGQNSKLDVLKAAAPALLNDKAFTDTDKVGLWEFSSVSALGGSGYRIRVPLGRLDGVDPVSGLPRRQALVAGIAALEPKGDTTLFSTTGAAVTALRSGYDPAAIDAVILLTDGQDDPTGDRKPDEPFRGQALLQQLSDPAQNRVRVFTIAYSASAAGANGKEALAKIAEASGGRSYDATTAGSLADALTAVISNF
ncbi:substrate-binding domain-containing protein [Kitasatospora sp. CB02891]|uniref:caspase, EACC1-associated type n=1 Tax=Kitasatospora sp. CB02891 TaxID=2020329 RepID=UPI000C27563C|nr:substrate-binding domain-containing protein [Kitasatospora sp. CB02891]PJN21108.1 hypothetical protein CG736_35245 [Kitasatospora sp. CB02891]